MLLAQTPANQLACAAFLTDIGLTVTHVKYQQDALSLLADSEFAFILLIATQFGRSEQQRCDELKKIKPMIPIIALLEQDMEPEYNNSISSSLTSLRHYEDMYRVLAKILNPVIETAPTLDENKQQGKRFNQQQITALLQQCKLYRVSEVEALILEYAKDKLIDQAYTLKLKQFIANYDLDALVTYLKEQQDDE